MMLMMGLIKRYRALRLELGFLNKIEHFLAHFGHFWVWFLVKNLHCRAL